MSHAMADCVFPEDIMVCILRQLPVKSLSRFKSVCKPWCELITTPEFVKIHYDHISDDPKNQSLIINSLLVTSSRERTMFLLSDEMKKPTNFGRPCPEKSSCGAEIVGCCNGLVCMGFATYDVGFVLWNPALRSSKFVPLISNPDFDFGCYNCLSLGFGYDGEDYKVVCFVCPDKKMKLKHMVVGGAAVYSVKSDSWQTMKLDFELSVLGCCGVLGTRNRAIVNGNPYWDAEVDGNRVLVWFDVRELVLKIVPLPPGIDMELQEWERTRVLLVDWKWKGRVGAVVSVYSEDRSRIESVDVWVLVDDDCTWRKEQTSFLGPIERRVCWFWQCTKNGKLVGEYANGKLFVFDPESGCVEDIVFDQTPLFYFGIHPYTESLACVKGMGQPLVVKEEENQGDGAWQIAKIKTCVDIICSGI